MRLLLWFVLNVYPLIFHTVMLGLRYLSHIVTILVYFIRRRVYFCNQYPLFPS